MSRGLQQLHSHSGLERELKLPKHVVLVDMTFAHLFLTKVTVPFKYDGVEYIKVDVRDFLENGGIFKNLNS